MSKNKLSSRVSTLSKAMLAVSFVTGWTTVFAAEPTEADLAVEEAQFKEGLEALEDDRLLSAKKLFETILSAQPTLHRARLELAVAYYRSLQYAEARKHAQTVLDDPQTPPEVRVTVLAFLAQINKDEDAAAERHTFKPFVSAGLMYDSNVNVGPGSDIIDELEGATLTPGSVAQSDTALVLNAGVSHSYQPGKTYQFGERTASFLWQSQASLYNRAYQDLDDFDLTILTGSTGPALLVLRHWRANIALNVDRIWLGGNELAIFTSLAPTVTWQFTDGELTWNTVATDRRYDETFDAGFEGTYLSSGLTLAKYFKQRKVAAQVGARLLDFSADDDQYGNNGYDLSAGVIVKAWPNGTVYARANYLDIEYDANEPFFGVTRDESERRFTAGFQHDIQAGYLEKWSLNGSFLYTDNSSNLSIYEYDRRQVMLNLARTF